jgi:hypothetical protein
VKSFAERPDRDREGVDRELTRIEVRGQCHAKYGSPALDAHQLDAALVAAAAGGDPRDGGA